MKGDTAGCGFHSIFVIFPFHMQCSETVDCSDKEAILCSLLLRKKLQNKVAILADFSTDEQIHLLGTSIKIST